jgi:hypothetical protein
MDIILTGIPRSGTTLTCMLLNRLPQCVALHEPMSPASLAELDFPRGYLAEIADFFSRQRTSLLAAGTATSKARDGSVPDNPYGAARDGDGRRFSNVNGREVRFDKRLEPGFRLVVKHPGMFTATLGTLATRYPCYALVRNPLASLLSWQSIRAPVQDGRVPAAEGFDAELKADLDAEPDRIERQLIILRRSFDRYAELLPKERVIRYEELVASGGRALSVIDSDAAHFCETLENRNANSLYDAELVRRLAGRLLADESIYASFYRAADVAELRDRWR